MTHPFMTLGHGAEIAHLLRTTLQELPPPAQPVIHNIVRSQLPIGGYLLAFGYITPQELAQASAAYRSHRTSNPRLLFGQELVNRGIIHPRVLSTMLLVQMVDRMLEPGFQPRMLGELLVAAGLIRPVMLAPVLQLQTWMRARGMQAPLGDLLVQCGVLTTAQIDTVLQEQHSIILPPHGEAHSMPFGASILKQVSAS